MNFSRTVWITFHCRDTTSRVSVMSSPILTSLPPQQLCTRKHVLGLHITVAQGRPETADQVTVHAFGSDANMAPLPSWMQLRLSVHCRIGAVGPTQTGGTALWIAADHGNYPVRRQ